MAGSGSASSPISRRSNSALFGELRDQVGATDGNLSAHLRKLEDAGYVRGRQELREPQAADPPLAHRLTAARPGPIWLDRMDALRSAAGS